VQRLNEEAIKTSKNIFYFSLSFHATQPFISTFPPFALSAINTFPIPLVSKLNHLACSVPYVGPLIGKLESAILEKIVSVKSLVTWFTLSIATPGIQSVLNREPPPRITLPLPGKYMPRLDVIPPMMPTCYAMSGLELTKKQKQILLVAEGEDWLLNDGVVNTLSQMGPGKDVIEEIREFPLHSIDTKEAGDAKGRYWHFGTNDKMDHADEIGVWIDPDTVSGLPFSIGILGF
jgi:hypothetical protein